MPVEVESYLESLDRWQEESRALQALMLDCGLTEVWKWRLPCYAHDEKNVAIIQPMKDFVALMFFKGVLLNDSDGLLHPPGKNSHAARRMCFTSLESVARAEVALRDFVRQAVQIEDEGLGVPVREQVLELVAELQERLDADDALRTAFDGLTPGRQREYNLYFSSAKQSKTRSNRVEKYAAKILAGKGMRER